MRYKTAQIENKFFGIVLSTYFYIVETNQPQKTEHIMETKTIKIFSNAEILTLNAIETLSKQNINTKLDPHTFRLINAIVHNVCYQLEQTTELKQHNITLNN